MKPFFSLKSTSLNVLQLMMRRPDFLLHTYLYLLSIQADVGGLNVFLKILPTEWFTYSRYQITLVSLFCTKNKLVIQGSGQRKYAILLDVIWLLTADNEEDSVKLLTITCNWWEHDRSLNYKIPRGPYFTYNMKMRDLPQMKLLMDWIFACE